MAEATAALEEFVASRLPLVRHGLGPRSLPEGMTPSDVRGLARYGVQQSFFYGADHFVPQGPMVSLRAWEWASDRWGDAARELWVGRRGAVPRLERGLEREQRLGFSRLDIIYEHTYTGTQFWDALCRLHRDGGLEVGTVVRLLVENYRTAWIHREEDARLPRSRRGECIRSAWSSYERAGIRLLSQPGVHFQYPSPQHM